MLNSNHRPIAAPCQDALPDSLRAQLAAALTEHRDALHHRLELLEAELPNEVVDGPRGLGDAEFVRLQYESTRKQLLEVTNALQRLADGVYGYCDACGQPIHAARLEAVPQTAHCLDCARSG